MGLRIPRADEVRAARERTARASLDVRQDGALEALQALGKNPKVEDLEKLAAKYPFHPQGVVTGAAERVQAAVNMLSQGQDKADWVVRLASEDLGFEDPGRLSTGSLVLDWITNGGVGRGIIAQFKGPESRGKTFAAMKTAETTLRDGGSVLWVSAERFNAGWGRTTGLPIMIAKGELQAPGVTKEQADRGRAYNAWASANGADRLALVVGRSGDAVLQKVVEAVETNAFDLIVVDSISVLRRGKALLKESVGKETRGGEAKLINDFCTRVEGAFNFVENNRDRRSKGQDGKVRVGGNVRSAVVVINQFRDQGLDALYSMRPDAGGGRGLKHAKYLDLEFNRFEDFQLDVDGFPTQVGRRTQVQCTKSKCGPPGRAGVVEIQYATVPGATRAGQWGVVSELLGSKFRDTNLPGLAVRAGVIEQKGAFYSFAGRKIHGLPRSTVFLLDPANAHVLAALQRETLDWIRQGGV